MSQSYKPKLEKGQIYTEIDDEDIFITLYMGKGKNHPFIYSGADYEKDYADVAWSAVDHTTEKRLATEEERNKLIALLSDEEKAVILPTHYKIF